MYRRAFPNLNKWLTVSLLEKSTWRNLFNWCAFNNFAWWNLRRWLLLKNFPGINHHEFCKKTRSCETFYPQKLYHIKLSCFIINIVNNLPAGWYLRFVFISIFIYPWYIQYHTTNKKQPTFPNFYIKNIHVFIWVAIKGLKVLEVLLTQQIL